MNKHPLSTNAAFTLNGLHISKMLCITVPIEANRSNAMFKCDILRCIFRATFWSSERNAGKKQGNAAEFLGSILHHANSFSMLWVRAAMGKL